MVARADELGLAAIGIADRNSFAGVVRAYGEARKRKIKLLVGTRLVTEDGFEALTYPTDRAAYGRLCRFSPQAISRPRKANAHLTFEEILSASEGQIFIALPPCPDSARPAKRDPALIHFRESGLRTALELAHSAGPHFSRRRALSSRRRTAPARAVGRTWRRALARRSSPSTTCFITPRNAGRLPTCVTCVREKCTLTEAGLRLARQCRTTYQAARRNGAAVSKLSRRHRPHRRNRQCLQFLAWRTQIRISRRAGAGRQDRAKPSRRSDLGGRAGALSARPLSGRHSRRRRKNGCATNSRSSPSSTMRAIFSPSTTSSLSRAIRTKKSSARAAAPRPTARCAFASASLRSIRTRAIFCSPVSFPRTAASRPTSTSISSTSGARK